MFGIRRFLWPSDFCSMSCLTIFICGSVTTPFVCIDA